MDRHEITLSIEYVNTLLLVYIFRNLIGHGFFSLYIDLQGSFFLQFNRTPRKQPLKDIKKKQGQTYHETVPHFNSLNAQFFFYVSREIAHANTLLIIHSHENSSIFQPLD